MLSENFTIRLDPSLRQKSDDLARREQRTTGSMVRVIVTRDLAQRGLLPDDRQPLTAVKGVRHDPS
jgi:hypothetical protein